MKKCSCCGKKVKDLYGIWEDMCWSCYLDQADEIADIEFQRSFKLE